MRLFLDTESGQLFTLGELRTHYERHAAEIEIDSGAVNFSEWLGNCLNGNGFLEEV